jgi:hypothetical protein
MKKKSILLVALLFASITINAQPPATAVLQPQMAEFNNSYTSFSTNWKRYMACWKNTCSPQERDRGGEQSISTAKTVLKRGIQLAILVYIGYKLGTKFYTSYQTKKRTLKIGEPGPML